MKKGSYEDWQKNPIPRLMWVWNDDVENKEKINKALLRKSADYITAHLIVMQIIMEKFNSCSIGICLNKDVENRMMKQIEMKNRILLYENRIG